MSKSVQKFMVLFLALTAVTACVKPSSKISKQKSADGGSCDLQAAAKESSDLSQQNFQCAYKALFLAGKFSTGETFTEITGFLMAISDLYQVLYAMEHLFNVYEGYIAENPDGNGSIDDGKTIFDSSTRELDKVVKDKTYSCFAKNGKALSTFLSLYKVSRDNSGDQVSGTDVARFASVVPTIMLGLTQMTDGLFECAAALDGTANGAEAKVVDSIKRLSDSLQVVRLVGECGLAIGRGGYMIAQNSMCLADDIKAYYDSRDNLDRQRDNTVDKLPVPQDDSSYNQSACMEKYGIFLQKQSFWTFSSRATVCADYCGGNSGKADYFSSHFDEIYSREDDRNACDRNVGELSSGLNACVTLCCDQNNSCVEAALSKSN